MVTGSRFREDAGYKVPWVRRTGIMLFSALMSVIVRQRVTDPTSGFRMTNRRGIELFARDYPHDYPEVEAILLMHAHRLRMREVPVRMSERLARPLVDHEPAQRLLHGQGAAGRARRAVPRRGPAIEPGVRGARRRAARDLGHLMDSRIQGIAVVVTALLLLLVFELVRRRRLMERYALLWLLSAVVLLVLAAWTGLLEKLSRLGRDRDAVERAVRGRLRVRASACCCNFSLVVSRLSDESKILAQQVARLDQELRDARRRLAEAERDERATRSTRTSRPCAGRRRPSANADPGRLKRLGVNLLYLVPGEVGGSEIYARNLLRALHELQPELELVAYVAPEALDSLSAGAVGAGGDLRARARALAQQAAARRRGADVAAGAPAPRPRGPAAQPRHHDAAALPGAVGRDGARPDLPPLPRDLSAREPARAAGRSCPPARGAPTA